MKKIICFILVFCAVFALVSITGVTAFAQGENTLNKNQDSKFGKYNSRSAFLVDYNTGNVLYERNADAKYPIASMVKIMTLNLVFEEINNGNLSLDEKIVISDNASGMGGSQMFLASGLEYTVSDLIKGITVASANDASVALAEKISGNVDEFISLMNAKAKQLGMNDTMFVNVTGLPQEGQYSTARDVTKMMSNLIKNPKYFDFSTIFLEKYTHPDGRITELTNTNKLIRFYKGCDGGKTGFTNDAMFCLSATAKRDNTRVIATVMGAENSKIRNKEVGDLFNYAFANYKTVQILEKNCPIPTDIQIKNSKLEKINVAVDDDVYILAKKNEKGEYGTKVELLDNLKAPIKKGEKIGTIIVVNNKTNEIVKRVNLVTLEEINSKSYLDSLEKIMENWFLGV